MVKTNQRGVVHLLLLVLLIAGIGLGVYLVQIKQVFFSRAASDPISSTPPSSPSLFGYWKMDEVSVSADCATYSILDSSGNNRHAKGCPSTGGPQAQSGKTGNGIYLDSNDYVEIADSKSMVFNQLTVASWIKLNSYSGNYPRIISKSGVFDLVLYTWAGGEGRLEWDIRLPGETDTKTFLPHKLDLNKWHHVAATYDGSTAKVYLNGVKVAEKTGLTNTLSNSTSHPITLGAQSADKLRNINATLDEARIYTRALSDTEINILANQTFPIECNSAVEICFDKQEANVIVEEGHGFKGPSYWSSSSFKLIGQGEKGFNLFHDPAPHGIALSPTSGAFANGGFVQVSGLVPNNTPFGIYTVIVKMSVSDGSGRYTETPHTLKLNITYQPSTRPIAWSDPSTITITKKVNDYSGYPTFLFNYTSDSRIRVEPVPNIPSQTYFYAIFTSSFKNTLVFKIGSTTLQTGLGASNVPAGTYTGNFIFYDDNQSGKEILRVPYEVTLTN